MEPSLQLPLWKKVLFIGVAVTFALVLLEGASRVYLRAARGYAGGDFLQYQFDAYKNIHLSRNWTDTRGVRHNAQGFRRSEDVARSKPDGTYRIFLMGASTAYGLGGMWPHLQTEYEVLDNSETIDAYLEQMLEGRLPAARVEVINAGIPSIWTHHHLIYLNQQILSYEPDMILFLDGFNDHFFYSRGHDQFASYLQTEQASVIMGEPTVSSLIRMNGWWWFRRSAFVHLGARAARNVKALLGSRERPPAIDVDSAMAGLQEVFPRNALKMIERNALLLEAEGIPAIFMLQPMLALERQNLERMPPIERELFEFNIEAWAPRYEDYLRRAAPWVATRVEETVRARGAHFLDLTGLYAESEGQIFTDYAHLTPEGNRILARTVADLIVDVASGTAPASAIPDSAALR